MKNLRDDYRRTRTRVQRIFAFAPKLLCLAIGAAGFWGLAQTAAAADPLQLKATRKAPNLTVAQQMSDSFDAGDSYQTRSGARILHRLAGEIAVKLTPGADKAQALGPLTAAGGPLAGYTVDQDLGNGLLMLKAPAEERGRQLANPGALQQAINRARGAVKSANPVFVDPPSGLWMIANEEVIIRLKPETDPVKYFGAFWPNVRRVGGTPDHYILTIPNATAEQVLAAVNQHAADPRVLWAEPNFRAQALAHQVPPNDQFYSLQWSLNNTGQGGGTADADIDAPEAWATTTGNSSTIIAILDCGVQTDHPDLNGNLAINSGEIAGNGIDDDGNGYVDDVNGWDFYATVNNNDPNPKVALDNHGTAVAGIAAALGNNTIGVAGGAYSCRLLPIRVGEIYDDKGHLHCSDAGIAEAIYYAAGRTKNGLGRWRGADVLSLSLGFPQSQIVDDAFTWAATQGRNGRGCPVFVSSGNSAAGWGEYTLTGFPAGSASYTFKWQYSKNGSISSGDDTVWLDNVSFPGGEVRRFEGTTLPTGWTTTPTAPWTIVQDGASGNHAMTGWNGPNSKAVRAGAITHGQSTWLQVTRTLGAGDMRFWVWVSSEPQNDQFTFWINGYRQFPEDNFSGVPQITTAVGYPASHALTIAVGASTDCDFRADYSQYGTDLDFVAPSGGGVSGIVATDRTGDDGYVSGDYVGGLSGTSAACPLAASVGALLLAKNPNLTAAEVRTIMRNSCDQIGGVTYTAGFNQFYGYGRINASRALGINNHPVVTVPGPLTTPEDNDFAITGISVADADAGAANVTVTLGASGVLTLGTTAGLTVTGNGTPNVTLVGSLNNLNTALGTLTYRNELDGTDTITVTANDLGNTGTGGAQTDSKTIPLTVTFVNDPPHFTNPGNQTILEDTWHEVTITVWDEETPADQLSVNASTWYEELIPQANITVTGTGSTRIIRYRPADNKFSPAGPYGAAAIFIAVQDPQQGSGNFFFNTVVQSVNDAPSFTKGSDQTIIEDAGAQTVPNWATSISPGPYEPGQTVNFIIDGNSAPSLFSVAPAIAANGTLTYTLAPDVSGAAVVTVHARDNGGTDLGGIDASAQTTFRIDVLFKNHVPSFTKGPDLSVTDAGAVTVPGWATAISPGCASEAGQTLNFILGNNNPSLFSVQPAVAADGTLTFTPNAGAHGGAVLAVRVHDDGGTANGGQDTSDFQALSISVSPVGVSPGVYSMEIVPGAEDYTPVAALGIDDYGKAVGFGLSPYAWPPYYFEYAFAYANGTMSMLPTDGVIGRANAIVQDIPVGYICYDAYDVPTAAYWGEGGYCLGGDCYAFWSQIKAISAQGYIVGYNGFDRYNRYAQRGTLDGWDTQLPGVAGSTWTMANGVNNNGEAVGVSAGQACYWDASGNLTVLGLLADGMEAEALAINDNGWIVGYNWMDEQMRHACLWKKVNGTYQAFDLGGFVVSSDSVATAINQDNVIVGYAGLSWGGGNDRACKWIVGDDIAILDLNLRVNNLGGRVLSRAYGINNLGQIVGATAWTPDGGEMYPPNNTANAFVLTPQ